MTAKRAADAAARVGTETTGIFGSRPQAERPLPGR